MKRFAFSATIILGALLLLSFFSTRVLAAPGEPPDPTPQPTPTVEQGRPQQEEESTYNPIPKILEKPVIPTQNPTLADRGSQVYWFVCMACHGNVGQGLTEEFRREAFGEDMNCWVSKCHASNHPPEGFEFPHSVPPVIGQGTLLRFLTADELQTYLLATMPWWNTAYLSEEQAWELTAFLLRENGVLADRAEFSIGEAGLTPVHLPARSQTRDRSLAQWVALCFGLAAALALLANHKSADSYPLAQGPELSAQPATRRPGFWLHLHPPTIPYLQSRFRYTLGAGGIAVFLTAVVVITGVLEMFFYTPTPDQAGRSVQIITFLVPFGAVVRNLHFWSAQLLVAFSALHLLRIIFTGAYTLPRRLNFLLGLGLLVLILLADFTGYVLRWDEGIRWALMVGTNLLKTIPLAGEGLYGFVVGGEQPGHATLTRFYAWHTFGLTVILVSLLVWHLFRVRRDGGIAVPPPEQRSDPRRIDRQELGRREGVAMLLAGCALLLLAIWLPAPLAAPIQDATMLFSEPRAPWYFLWVQQLLRYGDAFLMGVWIPVSVILLVGLLPFIFPNLPESQRGRWFPLGGWPVRLIVMLLFVAWLLLTLLEMTTVI